MWFKTVCTVENTIIGADYFIKIWFLFTKIFRMYIPPKKNVKIVLYTFKNWEFN